MKDHPTMHPNKVLNRSTSKYPYFIAVTTQLQFAAMGFQHTRPQLFDYNVQMIAFERYCNTMPCPNLVLLYSMLSNDLQECIYISTTRRNDLSQPQDIAKLSAP